VDVQPRKKKELKENVGEILFSKEKNGDGVIMG
jgi:hypothetical protein